MAAVPSVVIGFLAALWLSPILESALITFFILFVLLPLGLLFSPLVWQVLQRFSWVRRMPEGYEFLLSLPIIAACIAIAFAGAPFIEASFFEGDFRQWLFNNHQVIYDQRNCIVIAFALGFTVIPIVFTMSEDALFNVPRSLQAGSLALGASRWQTVARVILPSASPGIFAGCIIGFGRAVGETMIVLMATGNTPIIDWSLFNGMRTLSANIAVEIPEAPYLGTLYRVLFLSAVILFVMVAILNTIAEFIRQALRKKYGQFQ